MRCFRSTMFGLVLLAATGLTPAGADDGAPIGLKVPPGFTITRFADDSLAHDIFSMTTDTAGRVVVSGQGYVRILIDDDGDGKADRAREFVDGPRSGAQGLYFYGRDLLCTGDGGLIRYKDEDGDDRADGPPEMFLKVKTGSEHHSHAIRRGPDGWWYLIAGNFAEVTGGHATEKNSPIRAPHGGVIMRLKPDLSGGEIVCDGFRNAYDFDFDASGELFAYDSDGERDVSLPWYLPTRLFHVLPGGEHGWITESWKRPDYLFDSAPVVAATGRGSPTGVLCYRHTQFPERYRGALFILDWTFGRVLTGSGGARRGNIRAAAGDRFHHPRKVRPVLRRPTSTSASTAACTCAWEAGERMARCTALPTRGPTSLPARDHRPAHPDGE
jgi:putative membrane-bound dehydrogenase-like protein